MTNKIQNDVKIWADLALSDLLSAKILYAAKQYRTSYFLFQQAAEKAIKAYGLWADIIKPAEVKGISHQQFKIIEKYLKGKIEDLKRKMKESGNTNQKIETEYKSFSTSLEGLKKLEKENLINIPSLELISLYKELSNLSLPLVQRFPALKTLKNNKDVTPVAYIFLEEIFRWWVDFTFVSVTFWGCATLTLQHSTLPRYPQGGKNPQTIYTRRLALIKHQIKFMGLLERAIKRLFIIRTRDQILDNILQKQS